MAYIGLNTEEHECSAPTGGNPLPAGIYTGVITRTQLKDTKDETGKYLEVEFDISSPGEYVNRKFWDRFNIVNKSQKASQIGKEQLADLAKSSGITVLNEEEELHGKEVAFVLKVKPPEGNFQASNECVKYWPVGTTLDQHEEWRGSGKKGVSAEKQAWGTGVATATSAVTAKPAAAKPAPWGAKK